ncbi:MAG: hypothetical protein N3B10_09140 [Armatimonadetes bacterium]|nr:hypothetical protein [Armatimonadota bacterium]MCX7968636.1 hypothetical protein [Armatimonadota bacterium]MDW8142221.1 hypothetical protein [Armatimonadota bacterium]
MDVRLGDLYDLIIRIVDDRLRQKVEDEHLSSARGRDVSFPRSQEVSPSNDETILQTLLEQITNLIDLHRQLLETFQANQRRTETLLSELLNLVKQQVEVSRTSNGRRSNQQLNDEEKPIAEKLSEKVPDKEEGLKKPSEQRPSARSEKNHERSSKGYTVMSPPDLSDEEVSFVPSDNWLKEQPMQPATSELTTDGALSPTASVPSTTMGVLTDQLSEYLRRLFGIEVDYLRTRQTPSSPSLQDAQVLVGEGTYNGELVTLTIFGKPHITPTDVTVFYNAVVRPLRGSVTEPVLSIVFGETFEAKALKVAHALDLLVVNLKDLREISNGGF